MTNPGADSGTSSTTPTSGGALSVDASGYGGADREDAPDVNQGRQHVPGESPRTNVLPGPATMQVLKPKDSKSSKKK